MDAEDAAKALEDDDGEQQQGSGDGGEEDEQQQGSDKGGEDDDEEGEGEEEGEEKKSIEDSSEEEEGAEDDAYDMGDGFIATEEGEDGEEGEDSEAARRRRKKKRHHKRQLALDEEDYDLLEENHVKVKRPSGRKRLKRAEGEGQPEHRDAEEMRQDLFGNEDLEDELESAEPEEGRGRPLPSAGAVAGPQDKKKKKDKGGQKEAKSAAAPRAEEDAGQRRQSYDAADDGVSDDEEDEMEDFIVDEDQGEGGAGRSQARRRRRRALQGAMPGVSGAMMEEAADIFGDVGALMEMYHDTRAQHLAGADGGDRQEGAEEREDMYGDMEDEELDDEAWQRKQNAKEAARRANMLQKAMRILDAETLAAQHLMPADQAIREKDLPERLQLAGVVLSERTVETEDGTQHVVRDMDLEACAEWMYESMMGGRTENEQLLAMRRILEDGILEVDGSMPEPDKNGWPRRSLVDANPEQGQYMRLGSRRAIRKERTKHQLQQWSNSPEAQEALKANIKSVLGLMYEKGEEPCLIGMYRKEQAGELCCFRRISKRPNKYGRDDARGLLLEPRATTDEDLAERQEAFRGERADAYQTGTVQPKHRRMRRFDLLWGVMWQSLKFRKLFRRRELLRARLNASLASLHTMMDEDPTARTEAEELEGLSALLDATWSEPVLSDVELRLRTTKDVRGLELPDFGALSIGEPSQGTRGPSSMRGPSGQRSGSAVAVFKAMRAYGLDSLLREVMLTPHQLSENLAEPDAPPHLCEEPEQPPVQWLEYKLAEIPVDTHAGHMYDPESLMTSLRELAVLEIASHPGVRDWVRNFYFDHARLSTQCTTLGVDHPLMEPYAKYGLCRRLRDKPLSTFRETDTFLRVMQAVRERLITISLSVAESTVNNVVEQISNLYKSANVSKVAQEWNELRFAIIRDTIHSKLLPQLELETKQRLVAAAKDVALDRYSEAFWKLASAPPMRLRLPEEESLGDPAGEPYVTAPKVMACCWGSGRPTPTVVVALNEHGNLVDLLPCGQLSGRIPRSSPGAEGVFQDPRKLKDIERLRDKIMERSPHAIVVGTSDPSSAQLHSDIVAVCDHLLDYNAQWTKELELQHVQVVQADERLAMLWERCKAAQDEFPEQPPYVRRAIALGRLQLDPLPVLAQLCGYRREVLSLHLSDMQDCLGADERMRCIEELMVTAVSQVGADINLASNIGWRKDLLAFVPGLGPRKAQALLQAVARNSNKIESRNFMYKEISYVLGKVVFRNCGAYLRVTTAGGLPHLVNLELRQLDDSRVHPESYRLAVAMCGKAIGEEDVENAVDEHRDKIELVDLVELGQEKQVWPGKGPTLMDIHMELLAPFGEVRPPSQPLSEEEVFLLQHGETEESLCPGKLVEARVTWIGREEVKLRLAHAEAIECVIMRHNLSSKEHLVGMGTDLRNCVYKDQVIIARILRLQEDRSGKDQARRFMLELTSKREDLEMYKWEEMYCKHIDKYYHVANLEERERERLAHERAARPTTPGGRPTTPKGSQGPQAAKPIVPRPIKHPLFQNISIKDTTAKLTSVETPVGTSIVRPSESPSGLNLSVLLHRNADSSFISHFKIHEAENKAGRTLQLSTPIAVDMTHAGGSNLDYEDLDELHAAFVEPLLGRIKEYTSHRKFFDAPKSVMDQRVQTEFRAAMSQRGTKPGNVVVPYYLGVDCTAHRITTFFISFVPPGSKSGTAHHEYLHPTPLGFYFRKRLHAKLERLITEFKREPLDPSRRQDASNLGYGMPSAVPTNITAGAAPAPDYYSQAAAAGYYSGYDASAYDPQAYGAAYSTGGWDPYAAATYGMDPYSVAAQGHAAADDGAATAAYATGTAYAAEPMAAPAPTAAAAAAPRTRASKWDTGPAADEAPPGVPPPPPLP